MCCYTSGITTGRGVYQDLCPASMVIGPCGEAVCRPDRREGPLPGSGQDLPAGM